VKPVPVPSEGPPVSAAGTAQRETIAELERMGFVIETNGFEEAVAAVLDERDVPADAGRQLASLKTLETVRFWKCGGVDDTLVGQLAGLPELKVLATRAAAVTDSGLVHLARAASLESLNLGDCRGVTGRGLEKLAGRGTLKRLYLDGTGVTDETLALVADLALLETVVLNRTSVTDAGLAKLAGLEHLKSVFVISTAVSVEGKRHFEGQREGCVVVSGQPAAGSGR